MNSGKPESHQQPPKHESGHNALQTESQPQALLGNRNRAWNKADTPLCRGGLGPVEKRENNQVNHTL